MRTPTSNELPQRFSSLSLSLSLSIVSLICCRSRAICWSLKEHSLHSVALNCCGTTALGMVIVARGIVCIRLAEA